LDFSETSRRDLSFSACTPLNLAALIQNPRAVTRSRSSLRNILSFLISVSASFPAAFALVSPAVEVYASQLALLLCLGHFPGRPVLPNLRARAIVARFNICGP
jgi:hypothetical protein